MLIKIKSNVLTYYLYIYIYIISSHKLRKIIRLDFLEIDAQTILFQILGTEHE